MTATMGVSHEIRAANDRFTETFQRGNAAGMAALYAPGAQLLPTHGDLVTGLTAIEEYWRGVMEMDVREARRDMTDAHQYEDTALEVGEFTFDDADGQVVEKGTYVGVWRNHDGSWKLYRDIWNGDY